MQTVNSPSWHALNQRIFRSWPSTIHAICCTNLIFVAIAISSSVRGEIIASYTVPGTTAFAPERFGWGSDATSRTGISVGSVADDLGNGAAAWNITDNSPIGPSPSYFVGLSSSNVFQARQDGWWYRAQARYLTDFGTNASLGLQVVIAERAYSALFDLDTAGDLQVTLFGETSGLHVLTSGGSGTSSYHTFELFSGAQDSRATFRFDGQEIANWFGESAPGHADVALWGNGSPVDLGSMNFREVFFATGMPPRAASSDFNRDGVVDKGDLHIWSSGFGTTAGASLTSGDTDADADVDGADFLNWQQDFGNPGPLKAIHFKKMQMGLSIPGIPESSSICLTLLGSTLLLAFRTPR